MSKKTYQHVFPIIDSLVSEAVNCIESSGAEISCRKGCSHCCYLAVEISWEEAVEIARAVEQAPRRRRRRLLRQIEASALQVKGFLQEKRRNARYAKPYGYGVELPDRVFDEYFYKQCIACPILIDNSCGLYNARPVSCRVHMVTSPAEACSREHEDEDDYLIPEELDQLKEQTAQYTEAIEHDGRYGLLAVLVYEVLLEWGYFAKEDCEQAELRKAS